MLNKILKVKIGFAKHPENRDKEDAMSAVRTMIMLF